MSTSIPVKLKAFEGPLDLLLHLIDKNKVDICDIPISTITDQYLAYIDRMGHENMDVTSDFLVMAATLLDIKSRMLLPKDETQDDEQQGDPREELVRRLVEYKLYKMAATELKDRSIEASRNVYRTQNLPREVAAYQEPIDYARLIGDTTLQKLNAIFSEVLKRYQDRHDPVRQNFGTIVREEISVEEKQLYIRAYLKQHRHTDFRSLLQQQTSKESVIVTFLVVLELIKDGEIQVRQDEAFGEITIDRVASPSEKEPAATTHVLPPAPPVNDEAKNRYSTLGVYKKVIQAGQMQESVSSSTQSEEGTQAQWKENRSQPLSRPYSLPWVMPWKSALSPRHWNARRSRYWTPPRHWRKDTKRRGAALKSIATTVHCR